MLSSKDIDRISQEKSLRIMQTKSAISYNNLSVVFQNTSVCVFTSPDETEVNRIYNDVSFTSIEAAYKIRRIIHYV